MKTIECCGCKTRYKDAPGFMKRENALIGADEGHPGYCSHYRAQRSRAPSEQISQKPLRAISRLLVMYKNCLKRCFYHLEEFDLFGYLR